MGRRKKQPIVEEVGENVVVVFPQFKLPPVTKPPRKKGSCPDCGYKAKPSDRYASSETGYFYECQVCVDREQCKPTRWKEARE